MSAHAESRLVTVKQLAELERYRSVFTATKLRSLIAAAKPRFGSRGQVIAGNGLEDCGAVIRAGRRVLIDLARFEAWLGGKGRDQ